MHYEKPEALVTTEWLARNLGSPEISILDASFYLPAANRIPALEFIDLHIPGAVFFDINEIANKKTDLPHMLPSEKEFSHQIGNLGVSSDHHVICYDTNGGAMAAMRAWWTFRVFGHNHVSVLSGGLPKWLAEERPLSSGPQNILKKQFVAKFKQNLVKNINQIIQNVEVQNSQMVDARSEGRYHGTEAEPRHDLRQGHIPGAISLPFQKLLDPENFMIMRSADELTSSILEANIDLNKPLISSCGSGVTAAPLVLALYLLGYTEAAIYDGSWAEWARRQDTPIQT
jgi:thiosulfate/3-mercaptopyruvate sulfurtransferase